MMLNSFPSSYYQFILTYHLNNIDTIFFELHNLLQTIEVGKKKSLSDSVVTSPVMAIQKGKCRKKSLFLNPSGKGKHTLESPVGKR